MEEIVILPKKDWRGQRYGFVCFINVENDRLMEVKLDNLWLDGRKLKANVSRIKRYLKKSPTTREVSKNDGGVGKGSLFLEEGKHGEKQIGGLSNQTFADILEKGKDEGKEGEQSNKPVANKSFIYFSDQDERKKFVNSKVGVVKEPGLVYGVNQSLIEEGIFTIVATPLGPNLCLLEETIEGDLDLLLKYVGDWKQSWF